MRLHTRAEMYERQERLRESLAERRSRGRVGASGDVAALEKAVRSGVSVVSVPQLFETPPGVAARLVELADVAPGHRVLEPSAGTGNILRALNPVSCIRVAVEIHPKLAEHLANEFPTTDVHCIDFLDFASSCEPVFDRIIMNPPFAGAADIAHVRAAARLLAPGGRLVSIVAGGPRQERALRAHAETWEPLPRDTFAGTSVSAVVCSFVGGRLP